MKSVPAMAAAQPMYPFAGVRASMLRHGLIASEPRNFRVNQRSSTASAMASTPPFSTSAMRASQICRVPILAAVFDRTAPRTRSWRLADSPCATMPPIDRPTKIASRTPVCSISRSASRTSAPME